MRLMAAVLCLLLAGCAEEGQWYTVESAPAETLIRASGQLESADSVRLGPPAVPGRWNFTIAMIGTEGSPVRQGQPVLGFDPGDLRDRLQNARSALAEKEQELEQVRQSNAQAREREQLDSAERTMQLERSERKADQPVDLIAGLEYQKLHAERELNSYIVSRQQHRDALTSQVRQNAEAVIEAEIERLSVEVRRFEQAVQRMMLTAPRDGVLIVRSDFRGDKFARNSQVFLGQAVVEIPDLESMVARVQVPEREAATLQVGQPARVTLDADPSRVYEAHVSEINQVLRPRSRQVPAMVVDVALTIVDPDAEIMRPGMTVKAEVVADTHPQAISIPVRALQLSNEGAQVVARNGSGSGQARKVTLGARDQDRVIVLSGLADGDQVLLL